MRLLPAADGPYGVEQVADQLATQLSGRLHAALVEGNDLDALSGARPWAE